MPNWEAAWQQAKLELQQARDELKLKMHLARKDAQDELDALEAKYAPYLERLEARGKELKGKAAVVSDVAEETMEKVAAELREGLARVRAKLRQP